MEINRETFEAWLFSQPGDRIIEAGNINNCFLCSFVKETTNVKRITLGWTSMTVEGVSQENNIPEWAQNLICHSDLLLMQPRNTNLAITVAQMQQRYITLFGNPLISDNTPVVPEGLHPTAINQTITKEENTK